MMRGKSVSCWHAERLSPGQEIEEDGEVVAGAAAEHEQVPDHAVSRDD